MQNSCCSVYSPFSYCLLIFFLSSNNSCQLVDTVSKPVMNDWVKCVFLSQTWWSSLMRKDTAVTWTSTTATWSTSTWRELRLWSMQVCLIWSSLSNCTLIFLTNVSAASSCRNWSISLTCLHSISCLTSPRKGKMLNTKSRSIIMTHIRTDFTPEQNLK